MGRRKCRCAIEVWEDVYRKNADVARQLTMWAIPHMRKRKWGRVVTITLNPWRQRTAERTPLVRNGQGCTDGTDRRAMATQSLSCALSGITFNSVAPGLIDVGVSPASATRNWPLGRMGNA